MSIFLKRHKHLNPFGGKPCPGKTVIFPAQVKFLATFQIKIQWCNKILSQVVLTLSILKKDLEQK